MTNKSLNEPWHNDNGRPAYELPLIVDAPEGNRDISDWASGQIKYDYWLALRSGKSEWNARVFVDSDKLKTLEHGKTYNMRELIGYKILGQSDPQPIICGLPEKVQFIVEKL